MARKKSDRARQKPTEEELQGPPPHEATMMRGDRGVALAGIVVADGQPVAGATVTGSRLLV